MRAKGHLRWFPIAWSILAVAGLWLAITTALDPAGAWWVTLTFGGCALVAAVNVVAWLLECRRRSRSEQDR